jgi:hypothetical protein
VTDWQPGLDRGVQRSRDAQVTAARELAAFLREQLLRVEGRPADELLCLRLAIVARATTTLDAMLVLLASGHSEQAAMLIRPIFESVVDAHWARLHPEEALAKLRNHRDETTVYLRGLAADTPIQPPAGKARTPVAKHHWSGMGSLYKRMKAIGSDFPSLPGEPDLFDFDRDNNTWANWLLHGSSVAFDVTIAHREDSAPVLAQLGPTDEYVSDALLAAVWLALKLVWLSLDQAPPDDASETVELMTRAGELAHECLRTMVPVPLVDLITIGDQDPCPCGSRRPAAECHRNESVRTHARAFKATIQRSHERLRGTGPDPERDAAVIQQALGEFFAGYDEREAPKPPPQPPRSKQRKRRRSGPRR